MSNADRMPPHQILVMIVCLLMVTLLVPSAKAQLIVFSKQDLVDYTPQNPFDRFPDGRPRVPDDLVQRMELVTIEEAWGVLRRHGYHHQFEGGWMNLHPDLVLVGRAVTAYFVPQRPDLHAVVEEQGK